MSLDIRIPIGGMFSLLGLILVIYGLITRNSDMYARSLDTNINTWWGLVLLVFGGLMLYFGMTRRAPPPASAASPQRRPH